MKMPRRTLDLETSLEVSSRSIHDSPTISRTVPRHASFACPERETKEDDISTASAVQAMYAMLTKYGQDFPVHNSKPHRRSSGDTILVTGTTGGLGCALLSQLYEAPEVSKIYAFNRKDAKRSLEERQRDALLDRGYRADAILRSSKIVLLEVDLLQTSFGLSQDSYDEIHNSVTHIIHNAWPVNFGRSLGFFEHSIQGLRALIDFALTSPRADPPRLLFLSSISVLRHTDRTRPIKEEFVNASVAAWTGYSESKWVCEQLLALASRTTPLASVSLRVGQIAGSDNGAWNVHEWLPSLIKSSIYLECVPMIPANVSWMNASTVARAILEARDVATELSPLHLAHPRPVSWKRLFHPVVTKYNLQPVPFGLWVSKLVASAKLVEFDSVEGRSRSDERASYGVPTLALNPALKLLPFFRACNSVVQASMKADRPSKEAMGLPCMDVTKCATIAAKDTLSEERLKSLGPEDMYRWIRYWERVGYLPCDWNRARL